MIRSQIGPRGSCPFKQSQFLCPWVRRHSMKEAYEPLPAMFGWKAGSKSKGGGFRVQGSGFRVQSAQRHQKKEKKKKRPESLQCAPMLKVTHSRHDHSRIRLSGFSELGVPVFWGTTCNFLVRQLSKRWCSLWDTKNFFDTKTFTWDANVLWTKISKHHKTYKTSNTNENISKRRIKRIRKTKYFCFFFQKNSKKIDVWKYFGFLSFSIF